MYLSAGEGLPETLSEDDERDCIERLMQGDECAKQKLIEHNLRLVVYVAKKFASSEVDIEDLIKDKTGGYITNITRFPGGSNTAGKLKNSIIKKL